MQTVSANCEFGRLTDGLCVRFHDLGISAISLRGLGSQRTLVLHQRQARHALRLRLHQRQRLGRRQQHSALGDRARRDPQRRRLRGLRLRRDCRRRQLHPAPGIHGPRSRPPNTAQPRDDGGELSRGPAATFGFGDLAKDRFNVLVVVSYQKEKALFGRDRRTSPSRHQRRNSNDTTSGNTFPANIAAADGSFGTRNPSFPTARDLMPPSSPLFDPLGSRPAASIRRRSCRCFPRLERFGSSPRDASDLTPNVESLRRRLRSITGTRPHRIQPTPISDQFTIPLNNPLAAMFPYNTYRWQRLPSASHSYSTILLTSAARTTRPRSCNRRPAGDARPAGALARIGRSATAT